MNDRQRATWRRLLTFLIWLLKMILNGEPTL
ncbi:hypothetical protein F11_05965 [Rhodospirillum rubrum F11]|nr:hypothetical protein F11_05965 [Rhodospirillum rubrum F11]